MIKKILSVCIIFAMFSSVQAQLNNSPQPIIDAITTFNQRLQPEKLWLHTDRMHYNIGDTIWFKAYLLDASFFTAAKQSNAFYVELVADSNTVVMRLEYPIMDGAGWGDFLLDPLIVKAGNYQLRAYTNWMRNAGEETIYSQPFYIGPMLKPVVKGFVDNVEIKPAVKATTITKNIIAVDTSVDLQFMPEGGRLVAGIKTQIGFKAVAPSGLGISVEGTLTDNTGRVAAHFKTSHKGMGSFELTPVAGQQYSATIFNHQGIARNYMVPVALQSGIVMQVSPTPVRDSIEILLKASPDIAGKNIFYFLTGTARGVVCYGASLHIPAEKTSIKIPVSQFPAGIASFTLFNQAHQPINERSIFIDQNDALRISCETVVQKGFSADSILLNIHVADKDGHPVQGNFSLSVTDNKRTAIDTAGRETIISNLLISSQIKGMVEDPGYYFAAPENMHKIDYLMQTQAWSGFDWNEVSGPARPLLFEHETNLTITGSVTSAWEKPLANVSVFLYSRNPFFVADTTTDDKGMFSFAPPLSTINPEYIIKATNKKGRDGNVIVKVRKFSAPLFLLRKNRPQAQDDSNLALQQFKHDNDRYQKEIDSLVLIGKMLAPVIVKGKRAIKESLNLNGAGNSDNVLDEQDMRAAGAKTLQALLEEKIPGFRVVKGAGQFSYAVYGKPLLLVFDGTDPFYVNEQPAINFLEYFKPSDIVGMELMYNNAKTAAYRNWFSPKSAMVNTVYDSTGKLSDDNIAYLEITTRGKSGPFKKNMPGVDLYRPMPLQLPRQFYQPKYLAAQAEVDLQSSRPSTLYWNPMVPIDNGKVTIIFGAGEYSGSFTIHLEGTDVQGNLGVKNQTYFYDHR